MIKSDTLKADRAGIEELRENVATEMKQRMVDAIASDEADVIKKIACLFKSVDKQEEGMKHYTSYILKHKILKSLDAVIKGMYLPQDSNELINFSESFAQVHHILLACITDYSESILQLFDLESLLVFLT